MRQAACVATLALQAGIVTSPLWEPHTQKEVRPRAHVEETGAKHVEMHDGATCPVCSVRALASLPAPATQTIVVGRQAASPWRARHDRYSRDDGPTNRSRAPPLVS